MQLLTRSHMCTLFPTMTRSMNVQFSLSPAHSSWRCTATDGAHCYCFQFGARVDTSHRVWGMSKAWVGKANGCTTKASRNHCVGVWWVDEIISTIRRAHCASLTLYSTVQYLSFTSCEGIVGWITTACCYGNIHWLPCMEATLQM